MKIEEEKKLAEFLRIEIFIGSLFVLCSSFFFSLAEYKNYRKMRYLSSFCSVVAGLILLFFVCVNQSLNNELNYDAELQNGEVVRAKNCETVDDNKYCRVDRNEIERKVFYRYEPIKVAVVNYQKRK